MGASRLCFSTKTKTGDVNTGKGTNFDKFDDDSFFDKFLKDDEGDDEGYTSDDEKFIESTEKDLKRDNRPQFVPDEFDKLTQPEITKFYEDKMRDISYIIDPDLPGPDLEDVDLYDLIDKVKDEFPSASPDGTVPDLGAGIDDEVTDFTPRYIPKPLKPRVMLLGKQKVAIVNLNLRHFHARCKPPPSPALAQC